MGAVKKYKIVDKKRGDLIPYVNNSRTHSPDQVKQIAASIKEFGFTNPILIDDSNSIIAGHGRLQAAEKLKMDKVPCIVLHGLTEAQKKAYVIADNKLALNAGWDEAMLANEIANLQEMDFNIDLLGFSADEINDIIEAHAEPIEGLTDEDDCPEAPENPVTVEGDIWTLGNHRLMCGDSTDGGSVALLMDGKKADMVFTSPPYNIGKNSLMSSRGINDSKYKNNSDNLSQDSFFTFLKDFTDLWLNNTELLAINMQLLSGNKVSFLKYLGLYCNNIADVAIWTKSNPQPAMANNVLNSAFEFVLFLSPLSEPSRSLGQKSFRGTISNVYSGSVNSENKYSDIHSAAFPVAFCEYYGINFIKKNGIIADCFGGTGTTLIAAEKNNRHSRLMELDSKYCDVIIKRWQDYTGKEAILASNGKTFKEVTDERG